MSLGAKGRLTGGRVTRQDGKGQIAGGTPGGSKRPLCNEMAQCKVLCSWVLVLLPFFPFHILFVTRTNISEVNSARVDGTYRTQTL